MRLWSIDPSYLDPQGIVALWREGLLAKKVLEGNTKGYKNHPQLERFKKYKNPLIAINSYLYFVFLEGRRRGYNFDEGKICKTGLLKGVIPVTKGQLDFELWHLCKKLKIRNKDWFERVCKDLQGKPIRPNPLFYVVEGDIEKWEKL
ncbi:MAG: pyrimidine dimer DNA glycosylase/endonuclease V [bacterium]|nr:pyrimidine dimer DNA glycosylase/endonuclease V [bacterium]